MKISISKGVLKIDGKEVAMVVFKDHPPMSFPIDDSNEIVLTTDSANNEAAIFGDRNHVIQNSKNVVTGNISCKGDLNLGDR